MVYGTLVRLYYPAKVQTRELRHAVSCGGGKPKYDVEGRKGYENIF